MLLLIVNLVDGLLYLSGGGGGGGHCGDQIGAKQLDAHTHRLNVKPRQAKSRQIKRIGKQIKGQTCE